MSYARYSGLGGSGGGGGGVSSLNGETGAVILVAGTGISVTPVGQNITIAATNSGTVTSVTASSPLFSSGGATPNITIQAASAAQNGYLSSVDWSTFNSKQTALGFTPENVANKGVANGYASLDASALIPITQIPPAAIERLVIVADQTARYALTTAAVQNGDTVKQTDINEMFFVIDQTQLNNSAGYAVYAAGTAASVAWSGITGVPAPVSALSGTNTGDVTLGTANGLSLIGQVLSLGLSSTSTTGALSSIDWNTFNNKISAPITNYITNSNAESGVTGWNLYNNSGNTAPAFGVTQDLTYTAVASGSAGNGVVIQYLYNAAYPPATPNVNVVSSTLIQVSWKASDPTLLFNPTATQLKAAWDAVPGAVAIATVAITGIASQLQYAIGCTLGNGGDASPTTGTGGSVSGVTLTQSNTPPAPLFGLYSFDLGKSAANEQGQGVSTNFTIIPADQDSTLQISFSYNGSAGMVLGAASDVRVFIYDITNAALIPVTATGITLAGPTGSTLVFTGQFHTAINSLNYRLILHIATVNATAWDLVFDKVSVSSVLVSGVTQVPSLVLKAQPISGAVTDHMAVGLVNNGTGIWVPATWNYNGDYWAQFGFATNIVGATADIYVGGYMDGFHFGPLYGYSEYVDPTTPGAITTNPVPLRDTYLIMGQSISPTAMNILVYKGVDLIISALDTPVKGGLLSNSGVNNGTGDQVLLVGGNGNVLVANSAATLGINWAPAVVAGSGLTYTTSTRSLVLGTAGVLAIANGGTGATTSATWPTLNQNTTGSAATLTTPRTIAGTSFNGSANITLANKFIVQGTTDAGLTGAQFLGALATGLVKNTTTTGVLSIAAASDITGQLITGYVSGAGTVAATDTILQAINKLNGNNILKLTSPMTTLGDIIFENATPAPARLAGNITATKQFLTQTGTGTVSAAPAWGALANADLPAFSSTLPGAVVASGGGTTNFLRADGTWAAPTASAPTAVGAVVTLSAGVTPGAGVSIKWDTIVEDTNSAYSSVSGVYTAPSAGRYLVNVTINTSTTVTAYVLKNSVQYPAGVKFISIGSTDFGSGSIVVTLAAGGTVGIAIDANGVVVGNASSTFSIYKIGT